MKTLILRTLSSGALILATIALAGCKSGSITPIRNLVDDPGRYDKQTVRVAGTVGPSMGMLGYGAYEIKDDTGSLPVVSEKGGAPREGAKVGVEGEFRAAFTLGPQTAAVIIEKQRFTP